MNLLYHSRILKNNAFKTFDLVQKLEVLILALDQKFFNWLNLYLANF